MRKFVVALVLALSLQGCAVAIAPPGVPGLCFTNLKGTLSSTGAARGTKEGEGHITSLFGAFAWGDASVETAAKKAGITHVSWVDYHAKSVLGIWAQYTVRVYGD